MTACKNELMFRVWDSVLNKYRPDLQMSPNHELEWEKDITRYRVYRCLGYRDKNGMLIYEDDLVRYTRFKGRHCDVYEITLDHMLIFFDRQLWSVLSGRPSYERQLKSTVEIIGQEHREREMNWLHELTEGRKMDKTDLLDRSDGSDK